MPLRVHAEPAANGRFFEALIERAALLPPVKMGIVHPCDGVSRWKPRWRPATGG